MSNPSACPGLAFAGLAQFFWEVRLFLNKDQLRRLDGAQRMLCERGFARPRVPANFQ